MNTIQAYEQARDSADKIEARYNELKASIMAQIAPELAALDAEFAPLRDAAATVVAEAERDLRAAVLIAGQTIKGEFTTATFTKGRVSWDTKALDGYAAAHPEIERFRKVGDPSVTLRTVAQREASK